MRLLGLLPILSSMTLSVVATLPQPSAFAQDSVHDKAKNDPPLAGVEKNDKNIVLLIAQLGAPDWKVREEAQGRLLKLEKRSLPELRKALNSKSPEVAQRARFLLDILDPVSVRFRITHLSTEKSPHIVETLDTKAKGAREVRLSAETDAPSTSGKKFEYHLRYHPLDDGKLRLAVEVSTGSSQSWPLFKGELESPGPVTLLEHGEDVVYLRIGSHIERLRRPCISILEWDTGRRSDESPPPPNNAKNEDLELRFRHSNTLESLVAHLQTQLKGSESEIHSAIEILGFIRHAESTDLLLPFLEDPRTRRVTALALGRIGEPQAIETLRNYLDNSLEDSGDGPHFPGDSSVASDKTTLTEVALILLENGDSTPLDHLSSQLSKLDQTEFRQVLSAITSYLENKHGSLGDSDHTLIKNMIRKKVISQFTWSDVQVQYLYLRAAKLLRNEGSEEHEMARELLVNLGNVLFEEREKTHHQGSRAFLTLSRELGQRFPLHDVLLEHADSLLSKARAPGPLASCLAESGKSPTLPTADFEAVLKLIGQHLNNPKSRQANTIARLLVQFSQQVRVKEPQRVELVKLLWQASQKRGIQPGAILAEIVRQSRLELPRKEESAKTPAAPLKLTVNNIRERLESWLANPSFTPDPPVSEDDTAVEMVELDILINPRQDNWPLDSASEVSSETTKGRSVYILDARVLQVRPETPYSYEDRWKNRVSNQLQPHWSGAKAKTRRYRFENGYTVTANAPLLRSPRERQMTVHQYRSAHSSSTNYRLPIPGGLRLQSLVIVSPQDQEKSRFHFSSDLTPVENWERFEKDFVSFLKTAPSAERATSLRLVESLKLQAAVPIIRGFFEEQPSYQTARLLLRLNDETPLPYLRSQLKSADGEINLPFAQELTEHGDREGLEALLEALTNAKKSGNLYRNFQALENFLKKSEPTRQERFRILSMLFSKLEDTRYQSRLFGILRSQVGTDFGFSDSWRSPNGPGRKAAQQTAIKEALRWWDGQETPRED